MSGMTERKTSSNEAEKVKPLDEEDGEQNGTDKAVVFKPLDTEKGHRTGSDTAVVDKPLDKNKDHRTDSDKDGEVKPLDEEKGHLIESVEREEVTPLNKEKGQQTGSDDAEVFNCDHFVEMKVVNPLDKQEKKQIDSAKAVVFKPLDKEKGHQIGSDEAVEDKSLDKRKGHLTESVEMEEVTPLNKEGQQTGSDDAEVVKCDHLVNCDHCFTTGQYISASRYCSTCNKFFCPPCSLIHKRAKFTMHHTQTIPSTSSKDQQLTIHVPNWQECPKHKGEAIRVFCESHNALCCFVCLYRHHKSCQNTNLISDLAKGFKKSNSFKTFKEDLRKVEHERSTQDKMFRFNEEKTDSEYSKALREIDQIAEKAHSHIDKLKENTIKVATEIKNKSRIKLEKVNHIIRRLETDVQDILVAVNKEEKDKEEEMLYIVWKNSESKRNQIKSDTRKLEEMNHLKSLRLDSTEEINTLINSTSVLGTFSEVQLTLTYDGEIKVKSPTDKEDCGIEGIALLSPEKMVVADVKNKSTKLIDLKQKAIVQRRKFPEKPHGVAPLDHNRIGVVSYEHGTLQVLTADDNLAVDHTIQVNGHFLSIVQEKHHQHLIVLNATSIKVLSIKGVEVTEISTDRSGQPLFKCARYIALSPEHTRLYVSDIMNNTVTCLTLDGDVISLYSDIMLKNPRGICVDENGHVFVGSGNTHTIHVLSRDCSKLKVIYMIDYKILKFPSALAYCPTRNRLYISCAHIAPNYCNFIKVFKLQ